jgi:hypothetical protein
MIRPKLAVTGYFIDHDWEYQELLLGFEHLSGNHSGMNLSEVLIKLLQQNELTDRVLTITTDNASDDVTLMAYVNVTIQSLERGESSTYLEMMELSQNSSSL